MLPNIVYIFADDMGYGDLSCQNPESKIDTPHIDSLAREGMRFSDAHASSAVCTPSRYSVLTGRYCWRGRLKNGVLGGYSKALIEKDRVTVGSFLQRQGYHTACIGKWHLGFDWQQKDSGAGASLSDDYEQTGSVYSIDFSQPIQNGPTTRGFDYFFGISASLDMAPYCYIENSRVTELPNRTIEASPYNAFWREGPISPDFAHIDVLPTLTKKAVSYIQERSSTDKPFFLYFPLNGPHTPILPTEQFRGRSEAGDYGDFVMQCDDVVGKIMTALEVAGKVDNTLLIFTSDNGAERIAYQRALETGHYSSGQLRGLKRDIWEGGHRIPFVVRWPQVIDAGTLCAKTICLTDLLATVASITGGSLPDTAGEDSLNILPLLKGEFSEKSHRKAIIHHSASGKLAIRAGKWVLIDAQSGDDNGKGGEPEWLKKNRGYEPHGYPGELFDLSQDLSERQNLYGIYPEIVSELKSLLAHCICEGRSVE